MRKDLQIDDTAIITDNENDMQSLLNKINWVGKLYVSRANTILKNYMAIRRNATLRAQL